MKNSKIKLSQIELLEMIPEGWHQITLDTYINKILKLKVSDSEDPIESMNTNIQLASIFTGFEEKIIEQFSMHTIKIINTKLAFLGKKPEKLKYPKYNWIANLEDPNYDDFITFIKVSEQIEKNDFTNFPLIIKVILKNKDISDEEIMKMPMDEVEHGFFLLRKYLLNYLKSTTKDLETKVIVLRTNEMIDKMKKLEGMPFRKKLRVINEKYKELMAGISSVKK